MLCVIINMQYQHIKELEQFLMFLASDMQLIVNEINFM